MSQKITRKMLPVSQIRATIESSSLNEADRTIDLVWTTGAKGLRHDWDIGPYFEELSLEGAAVDLTRMKEGAPLLAVHNDRSLDAVIGVVEKVWFEPGKGLAKVRFDDEPESDKVFRKIKKKILRNVSVGYTVQKYEKVSDAEAETPTYRATRWTPMELSIVPIGFDGGAKTRNNEIVNESEVEVIETSPELSKPSEVEILSRSEPTKESLQMTEAELKDLAEKQAQEAKLAERTRNKEIRSMVKEAGLEDSLAEDMIERDISANEAKKNVEAFKRAIEQSEKTRVASTVRVEVGSESDSKRREGFEASILHRMDPKNFPVTEEAKQFIGKSLLRQSEIVVPRYSMESDATYATRVMSSSDLPLALANVAEKSLQKVYELQPKTFTQWTRSDTLRNYKSHSQVKSGDFGSLLERPEGKPFEQASFGEKNETVQLKDWGVMHAFTSQMLTNDDMSVINRLASGGGIAVARLENSQAYSALTTNKTMQDGGLLYNTTAITTTGGHANLGTAGAISSTTVAEAYKLMRKQKTTDRRDFLNLTPIYFVCGPDQEVTARTFFAALNPATRAEVNIFQGSMSVIVDPELTGNQYYFLSNPSQIDTVVCYRLEGQESPQIESRIDFNTNSLQLKVAHAFIAAPMDWRGIVKNAGQ